MTEGRLADQSSGNSLQPRKQNVTTKRCDNFARTVSEHHSSYQTTHLPLMCMKLTPSHSRSLSHTLHKTEKTSTGSSPHRPSLDHFDPQTPLILFNPSLTSLAWTSLQWRISKGPRQRSWIQSFVPGIQRDSAYTLGEEFLLEVRELSRTFCPSGP